jgi:hypothetical protein
VIDLLCLFSICQSTEKRLRLNEINKQKNKSKGSKMTLAHSGISSFDVFPERFAKKIKAGAGEVGLKILVGAAYGFAVGGSAASVAWETEMIAQAIAKGPQRVSQQQIAAFNTVAETGQGEIACHFKDGRELTISHQKLREVVGTFRSQVMQGRATGECKATLT